LATRMLLPGSIALALSRCTAAELAIIEALSRTGAELQPVAVADIAPLLPFAPEPALESLRSKALIFNAGAPDSYSLLPRVMQALPTDLSLLEQPEFSADEVRGLSAEKRQVLATIARAGGSMVTVGTHSKLAASHDLKDLLPQGMLSAHGEHTIALPRTTRQPMQRRKPTVIHLQAPVELRTFVGDDSDQA